MRSGFTTHNYIWGTLRRRFTVTPCNEKLVTTHQRRPRPHVGALHRLEWIGVSNASWGRTTSTQHGHGVATNSGRENVTDGSLGMRTQSTRTESFQGVNSVTHKPTACERRGLQLKDNRADKRVTKSLGRSRDNWRENTPMGHFYQFVVFDFFTLYGVYPIIFVLITAHFDPQMTNKNTFQIAKAHFD